MAGYLHVLEISFRKGDTARHKCSLWNHRLIGVLPGKASIPYLISGDVILALDVETLLSAG